MRKEKNQKKSLEQKKKVMLFGTFDGIHDGHRYLLKNAKKENEVLIVVVARDSHVLKLKNHAPQIGELERIALVKKEKIAEKVVLSDEILSSWNIIEKHKPDIVALGYDQKMLGDALRKVRKKFTFPLALRTINAHRPEKFHSSILMNKSQKNDKIMAMPNKKIKVGKYKTVFKGLQYEIKRAEVTLPSGKKSYYEMAEKTPGVMILALNKKKELILIREYRSRLKEYVWSLPGGKVNEGEKPEKAAIRELREESGYKAKKLRLFFFAGGGQSWVWKRYAYLAENLTLDPLPQDEDEDIREVITLPIKKAFEMAKRNEIRNENMAYMICRLYFDQDKWLS